jgi:hypothetical protein
MNKATRALLTDAEVDLVLETEGDRLAAHDEDELIALHDRVRRARNKYSKLHRRQAAEQVADDRARGAAATKNQRTLAKAEVFEDALARVSRRLAAVARQQAKDHKAERLELARRQADLPPVAANRADRREASRRRSPMDPPRGAQNTRARTPKPIDRKVAAHTRAAGKRTQARKDGR